MTILADKSGPEILAAVLRGAISFDDLLVNDCSRKVRRENAAKKSSPKKSGGKKTANDPSEATSIGDSSFRHVENLRANNCVDKISGFLSWHATAGEAIRAILAFSWYTPVFSRNQTDLIPCAIPGIPTGVVADSAADNIPAKYRLEIVTRSGADQTISAEFADTLAFTSIFNRGNVDEIRVFKLENEKYEISSSMRKLSWLMLTRESFWMITRRGEIAWEIKPRHMLDNSRALSDVYCEPRSEKILHVIREENQAYRVSEDSPWIVTGVFQDRTEIKLRGIVSRTNMMRNVSGPILYFVGNRGDGMRGKRPTMRLSSYFARTASPVPAIAEKAAAVWNDAQGIRAIVPTASDLVRAETQKIVRENPEVYFPDHEIHAGIVTGNNGEEIGEIVSDGDLVVAESFIAGQVHEFKTILEADFWIKFSAGM